MAIFAPEYTWEAIGTDVAVGLTEAVIRGEAAPVCVGSSLHAMEFHVIWRGDLYRAFTGMGSDPDWTCAEKGVRVPHPLDGKKIDEIEKDRHRDEERYRREIETMPGRHLYICRKTDDLQDILARIPMDLRMRHEMSNMITLLARMMLVQNSTRTLSRSKLDRF
ncbi:hypothetical protein CcrKarma_gp275 [Caulobacter virus Karma]|uniref:Uncharacterized protein n=1 Tax=Caulobacter phage CcrSwift TaxID=2927984 RepID=K4JVZ0_9CAUD|nr:hypothetical protein CcrKarma_gp275 [Caulobacter virus Karma]YP_006990000.1 hypothetical protein D870_gp154 [Caulobacter phage CcrSwift]AFU87792.1 hypothetical protein CcrKarma_gp275 [Caulobacter virus Karma]AFU88585.1 hypothetical protein CcrSwift_gp267 [Caulobacter phage CcrSwift]